MTLFIIGISMSMILFLLASGMNLIFGALRMANFAHGALYMFGAYVGFQFFQWTGNFWISLVLAPVCVAFVGAGLELLLFRPLYKYHFETFEAFWLMIQIGIIFILGDFVRYIWGVDPLGFQAPVGLRNPIEVLGLDLEPYRLFIIGLSLVIAFILFWGLEKTTLGIAVRAASSNPSMAESLGINASVLRTSIFAFGAGLAALAGVVTAAMYSLDPNMGMAILIDCFIVVVLGGLGNMHGAFFGAFILGMTRAYGQFYLGESVNILTYSIFIATLLFLPQGLFRRKGREA
jgi:branched-chain amino acid transport system permease protein